MRIDPRQRHRRKIVLQRIVDLRVATVPRLAAWGAFDRRTVRRRLRRQMTGAIVQPDDESAIGCGYDVDVAVSISSTDEST